MGDAADHALAAAEARAEDQRNARDQARHEAEEARACVCWHPDAGTPEPAQPDPACPVHGRRDLLTALRQATLLAPSCRCEPGRRDALCDLHGEVAQPAEAPLHPHAPCVCSPYSGWPDESCDHHGVDAVAGRWATDLAPEPRDPWLTHYDPLAHGLRARSEPARSSPSRRS